MLTYETLRKIAHEEKGSNSLTKLPEDFLRSVQEYMKKKEQMSKDNESQWEFESVRLVLEDILKSREKKILMAAHNFVSSGAVQENLTPEEREFFNSVVESIKQFHLKRKNIMDGEIKKQVMLAVLGDVPQFVGIDMKN